jgi:hypothetical protein
MSEIYEYSGYLTFSPLPAEKLEKARSFIAQSGLGIDVEEATLEFEYAGRDAYRKVIALLRNLASLIGKADGEIICEIANEDGDPMFEFYTIKNRGLYVQKGHIVREKSKQKVGQQV